MRIHFNISISIVTNYAISETKFKFILLITSSNFIITKCHNDKNNTDCTECALF